MAEKRNIVLASTPEHCRTCTVSVYAVLQTLAVMENNILCLRTMSFLQPSTKCEAATIVRDPTNFFSSTVGLSSLLTIISQNSVSYPEGFFTIICRISTIFDLSNPSPTTIHFPKSSHLNLTFRSLRTTKFRVHRSTLQNFFPFYL